MIWPFKKEKRFYITYSYDVRKNQHTPAMSHGDGFKNITVSSGVVGKKELRVIRKFLISEIESVLPMAKNKRVIINIKNIIKLPVV